MILMHRIKKILFTFLLIISIVIAMIGIYGMASVVLSIIPVNRESQTQAEPGFDIFFISNGVHFDILLPKENEYLNWKEALFMDEIVDEDAKFVGFGWGDKGFYLTTPTWADLTFSTAFKALFLKSESAIHVSFYSALSGYSNLKRLRINILQLQELIHFISSSFKRNDSGNIIKIEGLSYGDHDCFYEANRSYSLFYTCNSWANQAFKKSGLRACVWTPFDKGLLYQYRNLE